MLLTAIGIASLSEVKMSPKISDGQIKYIVLSIMINAMANRALRLDVAPSKILGVYHNHKSSFCQVLQNARIRTGGSFLRLMLSPARRDVLESPQLPTAAQGEKTEKLLLTTHLVSLLSILTHFFILFIPISKIQKFFH